MRNSVYMKFLYIKDNNSGFKEYNFSKTLTIFTLLVFAGAFVFIGFGISKMLSGNKVDSLSEEYSKSISDANIDIENIEEQIQKLVKRDNLLRSLIGLPEIPDDVRTMGTGGESNPLLNYLDDSLRDGLNKDLDYFINKVSYLGKISRLQKISYSDISDYIDQNLNKILRIPAIHPIPISEGEKTSGFGMRRDPYTNRNKMHEGQDFNGTWAKTPILATANGTVKKSKRYGTYGNYIEIDHGNGFSTVYAHLHRRYVKKGDKIVRGQKIGTLGNTGKSTGPHLHYEVKKYGKPVNPEDYFFDNSL